MNPEEFEEALKRDLASAPRRDPTPAWKADILAHATARPTAKVITFPRLILLAWAACWMAALVLRLITPAGSADLRGQSASLAASDWRAVKAQRATMLSLLAANDSSNLPRP